VLNRIKDALSPTKLPTADVEDIKAAQVSKMLAIQQICDDELSYDYRDE
jgi:hypothetical protein